ncbi:MAG: CPBP family intramembrane metalloprotease [Spirochaetaceae bacterium]|nr:MAG: CPBP family intramembrane metalloprotease [Spirochaetaceae bacterium]
MRDERMRWILFLTALLLAVPRFAGIVAGAFSYSRIDPDGAYAWISVHHIVQALPFLAAMIVIGRVRSIDFGFGWGDRKTGFRFVRIFSLVFAGYTAVSMIIVLVFGTFRTFPYPLTARNVIGQLAFQLLLSGPSEELIFRAFAITMLMLPIKRKVMIGPASVATILAAIIFALAHVGVSLSPFTLIGDPFQVVYAAGLGVVYGICYERTGSVYYPMILHSISNVVAVAVSSAATLILA